MNREDFNIFNDNNVVYFDNAATTFKPDCVVNKICEYYYKYCSNSHRGDYDISFKVDDEIDNTREVVHKFINSKMKDEIIFTKNTTDSLNQIVFGFFYNYLDDNDEVLLSSNEHASNILPWLILSKFKNIKIRFIKSDKLSLNDIKNNISNKTKVISIAHVTNVYGDVRDIESIIKFAHEKNILVVIDGAQSVPHMNIDVQFLDIDFLAFSAHKMCGPTGVGILYGKYELLKKMKPLLYGGGMNKDFNSNKLELLDIPYRFEAGTINIADVIGFSEAIKYLNNIGIKKIENYIIDLRSYFVKRLKEISYIKIYNEDYFGNTIVINMDGVMSGDLGLYLNSKKICVRSGKHCAKMINNNDDTVRISLYFYNTYDEVDYFISVLKEKDKIIKFVNN